MVIDEITVCINKITLTSLSKYCDFFGCKNYIFQMKNCYIFLIFVQNIDRGFSLEPPGPNACPQSMFLIKNKNNDKYIIKTNVLPHLKIAAY